VDQGFLGALDRALDGLQLLSDFQTWSVFFDHFDDGLKVAVGTLKPSDNGGVILVGHVFSCPAVSIIYPPWGIKKYFGIECPAKSARFGADVSADDGYRPAL
jgi:hypothetical protein